MSEQQFLMIMNEYVDGDIQQIPHDEPLHYVGVDSMRMMMAVEAFRAQGSNVTFMELVQKPTLAEWLACVVK